MTVDIGDAEASDLVAGGRAEANHQGAAAAEHDRAAIRLEPRREGCADGFDGSHDLAMANQAAARVAAMVMNRSSDIAMIDGRHAQ